MKEKVILLDFGIFQFRAIFAYRKMRKLPVDYIALNMMISALKRIGISPMDKIIVACDGRNSWRKDYEKTYKANRKEFRDSFEDINWNEMWNRMNNLLDRINKGTDWYVIKEDRLEADDIMAVASKFYVDKEVIVVSYDQDLEQLWDRPNVKIFTIMKKFRNGKGVYKIPPKNFNAYKLITKKIQKEVSDNLTEDILTKQDYEKRKLVIDLLNLPEWVEETCINKFKNLSKDNIDSKAIPYTKLREKIGGLWNNKSNVVTYEDSIKRELRKKKKRRNK